MRNKTVSTIIVSSLISLSLFLLIRPIMVSALVDITSGSMGIFEAETKEDRDGFRQIVTRNQNGTITFITSEKYTHDNPSFTADNIVWMGQEKSVWDIFIYNVDSKITVKLTTTGNNVNPQISGNYVTWEGMKDGVWQIFLYDGMKIHQITNNDNPKQDVKISDNLVVFSQKVDETWSVFTYDIASKVTTKVSEQDSSRLLFVENDVITFESANETESGLVEYNLVTKKYKKVSKLDKKADSGEVSDSPNNTTNDDNEQDNNSISISDISKQDILDEMGIENPIEDELQDIIQDPDVPESTESQNLDDLLNSKDVQESTESSN